VKRLAIRAALKLAEIHTSCASFWNDVAEWLNTGGSISSIRKQREEEE
jgi:hypothetical protein